MLVYEEEKMRRTSLSLYIVLLFSFLLVYAQQVRWRYRLNGTAYSDDEASDIVVGLDGNIYIAGLCYNWQAFKDFTVVSLTDAGSQRWVYTYDWHQEEDFATAIAYGNDGNLYVAGAIDSSYIRRFVVISLTSSGSERWRAIGYYCWRRGTLLYASDGNLYGSGGDIFSLTNAGGERWVYHEYHFYAMSNVVRGNDGNLYVAGSYNRPDTSNDFAILSLTSTGSKRWLYTFPGTLGEYPTGAYKICYGTDGNIYATGYYGINAVTYRYIVLSITNAGTERWAYQNGGSSQNCACYDLIYDTDGNIYTSGYIQGNIAAISLTSSGSERWIYSPDLGSGDEICSDQQGNLYIAGYIFQNYVGGFGAVCLTRSGIERWRYIYGGASSSFEGWAHAIDKSATAIFLAGDVDSTADPNGDDLTVVSLNQESGISENKTFARRNTSLFASPNPFSKTIYITYDHVDGVNMINTNIYDITGRNVKRFNYVADCQHTLIWDGSDDNGKRLPSGLYILRCQMGQDYRDITIQFVNQ